MHYPVVVHKDPKSDYGVTVLDLPGCFSAGTTLDEALTPAENQELGELIEQIEQSDVERLQGLVELAQLRNMPLARLMEQIGMSRSPVLTDKSK